MLSLMFLISVIFRDIYLDTEATETFITSRIWRVLTMVYNTQNYWVSGPCPSSEILNIRKHEVSETGSVSVPRWGEGDTYSAGSLRKGYPQSLENPSTKSKSHYDRRSVGQSVLVPGTKKNYHLQLYYSSTLCMLRHNFPLHIFLLHLTDSSWC
jgi:hypothetical protein